MMPLELLWNRLDDSGGSPAFLRVNETHPLDIYVGKDVSGERLLLLLTDEEPPAPGNYKALQISKQQRRDGRWALTVKLVQKELLQLFTRLCQDLADSTSHFCEKRAATRALLVQLEKWQRLMARGRDGLLSESEIRGLVAELVYLEKFAIPFCGAELALNGWVGPLEADQDFRLGDRLVEIKSCGVGGGSVTISSEDQLDVADTPLFLVVVTLEACKAGTNGALSLNEVVLGIRSSLERANDAILFDARMTSAGYVERPEYSHRGYVVQKIRHFKVEEGFPGIMRSRLPQGISHVRYQLSLFACAPFEKNSSVEV